MDRLAGAGVSPGVGYGPVRRLVKRAPVPQRGARHGGDADAERARAAAALEQVAADLEERGAKAGGVAHEILSAQAMMARDPDLSASVHELIGDGLSAARAVYDSFAVFREAITRAGGYFAERAADLDDVRDRAILLLDVLAADEGTDDPARRTGVPYVLVARDIAPADAAVLPPGEVAAFVIEEGGPTSHTAILARAMGVPAVVACSGATRLPEGTPVLVDGTAGEVRVAPPEREVARARARAGPRTARPSRVRGPGRTADGRAVELLANIGTPRDVEAALGCGAEGVGLYRTEFLFMDRRSEPGPDEQRDAYRPVLEAFPEGRVVVRTLDAGADKPLAFLPPPEEEPNPALGRRGLRLHEAHPRILENQLDALARAASGLPARLQVMAPMVATVEGAEWFVRACRTTGLTSAGVMIEVPAAAVRARDLATVVDFFSIGTNDLAQYAFAADRQLGALHAVQDPWHPALLDLVALVADAGERAGLECGVCGEAAADPALACVLAGLGVSSLSMTPTALSEVRAALAGHTFDRCRAAAEAARAARTAAEARAAARAMLPALGDG
ncbi:phosphoenolpyruvate--protein phosphotransferase [Thermopolyspora sp. NPDC052614]|uniref:phosphoenolpyruvate--protein phosphotransferase n=1 Tax=Thermopolyspora sp. NPDC052614 TaxID=3155682 RepID=UPI003424836F